MLTSSLNGGYLFRALLHPEAIRLPDRKPFYPFCLIVPTDFVVQKKQSVSSHNCLHSSTVYDLFLTKKGAQRQK